MAADRGAFIDQSQSLNVYMAKPTVEKLTSMHFYGWKIVSLQKIYLYMWLEYYTSIIIRLILFLGVKNWYVLFAYKTSCKCASIYR